MNKAQMNLQDNFLNQLRKDNTGVTIYLISGVQLKGYVRGFDSFTLLLETPGKPSQLVYKHAMASIVPTRPVYLMGGRDERDERTEPEGDERPEPEGDERPEPEVAESAEDQE
jgi:host factor-I protein